MVTATGIQTVHKTDQFNYCVQEHMDTLTLDHFDSVTQPLMIAYDRACIIDEVVIRAGGVPTIYTVMQLFRAADGTADTSATAMGTNDRTAFGSVIDTNFVMNLYSSAADVDRPRRLDVGDTLFFRMTASLGDLLRCVIYVRWHDADGGSGGITG